MFNSRKGRGYFMISAAEKAEVIKRFGKKEGDTASPEIQIALLTTRIKNLMPHFDGHKHDYHSKRGLMKLIGKRKSLLKYLGTCSADRYQTVLKQLGLRK